MPIVLNPVTRTFVLNCINGHRLPNGDTTMVVVDSWVSVDTTIAPGFPADGSIGLRCYYCSVCGYVEMYAPQRAEIGAPGV